jgi:hypothetical protein
MSALFGTVRSMHGSAAETPSTALFGTTAFVIGPSWYTMAEALIVATALPTAVFNDR